MARRTLTKQQRINRQYREQIRRIERNYRDIERMGGSFSQSLNDIIRPVTKPTEATIRRLRRITKDDLYRKARTETGDYGWRLKVERQRRATEKAKRTREIKKKILEYTHSEYDADIRKRYRDYRRYTETEPQFKLGFEEWKERELIKVENEYYERSKRWLLAEQEDEDEDEEQDSLWTTKESESEPIKIPEPEYEYDDEPSALPDNNYKEDITDRPSPFYSSDLIPSGNEEAFYFALDDVIETALAENQDKSYARALLNEYSELKERLSTDEFMEWMRKNGDEFSKLVEEVTNYKPAVLDKGNALNKFNQAMNKLNDGITPLDKFDSYYNQDEETYDDEEEYYDEEEDEDNDWVDILDQNTGEVIKGRQETYLSRIDKWGRQTYSTKWVDEDGMTLDVGNKRSHFVPISWIKNIEDYLQ